MDVHKEEVKLTYDEAVAKYSFKQSDIDKIMKRTKPQTEVDGIRFLVKEGERRAKLKQAYADRIAKENASSDTVGPTVDETGGSSSGTPPLEENPDALLEPTAGSKKTPFAEATKKIVNGKVTEICKNLDTIIPSVPTDEELDAIEENKGFFLGNDPVTGKPKYRPAILPSE